MVWPRHPPQQPTQDHPTRDIGRWPKTWTASKELARQHQRVDKNGHLHPDQESRISSRLEKTGTQRVPHVSPTTPAVRGMRWGEVIATISSPVQCQFCGLWPFEVIKRRKWQIDGCISWKNSLSYKDEFWYCVDVYESSEPLICFHFCCMFYCSTETSAKKCNMVVSVDCLSVCSPFYIQWKSFLCKWKISRDNRSWLVFSTIVPSYVSCLRTFVRTCSCNVLEQAVTLWVLNFCFGDFFCDELLQLKYL